MDDWIKFSVLCALLMPMCAANCYFPVEYHGTFLMQTQATQVFGGHVVQYSEITIEADAIPPWGTCHRRRGEHNVILRDSTGSEDCMRCFHLTLKSPNVIQIHAEGLARCYTNEDAARATCPDDRAVTERRFKEIILYRKPDPDLALQSVFCPLNGRYRFQYKANGDEYRCTQPLSEISNCPSGNELSVKFRQCTFPDFDLAFVCLGDWAGPNKDRYLALMDLRDDPESRPKYRCGMYREDLGTGRVFVSLSADSTCQNQLTSGHSGYESLVLTPIPEAPLPASVEQAHCRFPEWIQGEWERTQVDEGTLVFKDNQRFATITTRCIDRLNSTPNDRLTVHIRTQCGEEQYSCIWLRRRALNVMEFKLSLNPSVRYTDDLCADSNFKEGEWITQGRIRNSILQSSISCPITGDYVGVIPGTSGLCARIASDCNNPDIMFYTVSSCENRTHIYEEREYKCLGSWEENGVTFTFTHRRDVHGFQCFSGKVIRLGEEAYIKEAGENCERGDGEDPILYGMKITKQASCSNTPLFIPEVIPTPPPPARKYPNFPPSRPRPPQPPSAPENPSDSSDPYWYRPISTRPWHVHHSQSRHPDPDDPKNNEIPGSSATRFGARTGLLAVCTFLILYLFSVMRR